MAPYSPPGGPFTPPPGPSAPPPPAFGSGGGWRPRGGGFAIALGIVAIVAAVAALIVALVRGGESSVTTTPTAQPTTSSTPTAGGDTTAADKALCQAIAPLMAENDRTSNAFLKLGDSGTPERDAALSKYVSDTQDWARRIQAVFDSNRAVQPYFERTLQRYIDDTKLLVTNMRPGPSTSYDRAAYADSLVAYGGPLSICQGLGINW
jgi:hypothetical protein